MSLEKKNKLVVCVIDTETTMKNEHSYLVYDFAYAIGNVYDSYCEPKERNFLINDVLDRPEYFLYSTKKILDEGERLVYSYDERYGKALRRRTRNGVANGVDWNFAMKMFWEDCSTTGVDVIVAYNLAFDLRALRNTCDQIDDKRFRLPNGVQKLCLQDLCATKVINNDFHNWFNPLDEKLKNQFTTDNDNISYSAECIFRYWFDNYYYNEQHTALRDVRMEWKLIVKCFERWDKDIRKKFIDNVRSVSWSDVNKVKSATQKMKLREKRKIAC